MKLLSWLIGLPVAVVAILFAVVNRHAVQVGLWPLPWQVNLPLYLLVLGALAVGLIVGGVIVWVSSGKVRSRARREGRRARALEREVEALRDEPAKKTAASGAAVGSSPTTPPKALPGR